jgi:cell division protein FtsW
MAKTSSRTHSPDVFFLTVVVTLLVFGFAMLASASSDLGKTLFNNSYYYLEHQAAFGLTLGLAGFALGYFIPYQKFKKIAFPLLIVSIVCLALVFTKLGASASGATRWLRLGPLSFQPAEIMKLTYLLYLAAWLANTKINRSKDLQSGLVPFALITGLIAILLVLQPATSTVVILIASGLVVYFVSGAPLKYILTVIGVGVAAVALLVVVTPYRLARITGFLNQGANTQSQNYQLNQALIAIGSGGSTGQGYGQSAIKASYLPDPINDSIFAVVAEELGFVGGGALIALFCMYTFRLYWLARDVTDKFGRLLLIGFGTVVALQAFVNMASISGILPLTGVPLPFISYGGTALAIFLTMSGIALNISRYT